jgi:hypothetical protein
MHDDLAGMRFSAATQSLAPKHEAAVALLDGAGVRFRVSGNLAAALPCRDAGCACTIYRAGRWVAGPWSAEELMSERSESERLGPHDSVWLDGTDERTHAVALLPALQRQVVLPGLAAALRGAGCADGRLPEALPACTDAIEALSQLALVQRGQFAAAIAASDAARCAQGAAYRAGCCAVKSLALRLLMATRVGGAPVTQQILAVGGYAFASRLAHSYSNCWSAMEAGCRLLAALGPGVTDKHEFTDGLSSLVGIVAAFEAGMLPWERDLSGCASLTQSAFDAMLSLSCGSPPRGSKAVPHTFGVAQPSHAWPIAASFLRIASCGDDDAHTFLLDAILGTARRFAQFGYAADPARRVMRSAGRIFRHLIAQPVREGDAIAEKHIAAAVRCAAAAARADRRLGHLPLGDHVRAAADDVRGDCDAAARAKQRRQQMRCACAVLRRPLLRAAAR